METIVEAPVAPAVPAKRTERKQKHPKRLQHLVIPRVVFSRLTKEIARKYAQQDIIWSQEALVNLQELVEKYVEQYFRVGNNLAGLCKRATLTKEILEFLDQYKAELLVH